MLKRIIGLFAVIAVLSAAVSAAEKKTAERPAGERFEISLHPL